MSMIDGSNGSARIPEASDFSESGGGLSRRAILKTATVAAGAAAGMTAAAAQTSTAAFGAPLVELHVPAGVLTLEQKGAMIKGVTDVLVRATKLPPDQAKKLWVRI